MILSTENTSFNTFVVPANYLSDLIHENAFKWLIKYLLIPILYLLAKEEKT